MVPARLVPEELDMAGDTGNYLPPRNLYGTPTGIPSFDALGAAGAGAGSTVSGSTWQGPNAPRENYTQTPNLLPQEHAYALEQSNNDAAIKADQMRLQAQLAAQAESRRLASIKGLMPGTGSQPGSVDGAGGMGANEEAARAAAFGRAKEQAGNTAMASLKALEDVMGARGLRGSTIEGNLTGDVLTGGMHELNDLVRSQTISDNNRAGQVADRNYAGNITQRGQDMDYMRSLLATISAGSGLY